MGAKVTTLLFIALFLGFIFDCPCVYSQQTKKVSAEYTLRVDETTSIIEAKRIALERAKIQGIADAFGTNISQQALTAVSTVNGNSSNQFFLLGFSDVKGEWIETIGEPQFKCEFESPLLTVTCRVTGKIREIAMPELDIEAKILRNGENLKFESTDFIDGDDIYMYFKTSQPGNIIVFLLQGENVYRLLPYKNSESESFFVKGERPYILFSKKHSSGLEADEYQLFADRPIDFASIIIMFTPNSINMPTGQDLDYDEPLSMDAKSFHSWLIKKRGKDIKSRLITIPITIRQS